MQPSLYYHAPRHEGLDFGQLCRKRSQNRHHPPVLCRQKDPVEFCVSQPKVLRPTAILALEKINVCLDGTPRIPVLERIAPGVNVKDVRTWVFYFSIHGKDLYKKSILKNIGRLCRAAKEKQLRGKAVVYLNCSNKFRHRCRWKIKMSMLNTAMTPDMDMYS